MAGMGRQLRCETCQGDIAAVSLVGYPKAGLMHIKSGQWAIVG